MEEEGFSQVEYDLDGNRIADYDREQKADGAVSQKPTT